MTVAAAEALAVECAEDAFLGWVDDDPGRVPRRPAAEDYEDAFGDSFGEPFEHPVLWDAFERDFDAHLDKLSRGARSAHYTGGVNVESERETTQLFERVHRAVAGHLAELRSRAQSIREQAAILEVEANGVERVAAHLEEAVCRGAFDMLAGVLPESDLDAISATHPADPAELLRRDTWAPEATRAVKR